MTDDLDDIRQPGFATARNFLVLRGTEIIQEGRLDFPIELEHDPDLGFWIQFHQRVYRDGYFAGTIKYEFSEIESFWVLGDTLTINIKKDREHEDIEP